jgi:hypothetical protein
MNIRFASLPVVAGLAGLAALPLSLAIDNMRLTTATLFFVGGAAFSASAWLVLLLGTTKVGKLGPVTGALLGFLSFATVVAVLFSLPSDPGATATLKGRAIQASFVFLAVGLYPVLAGGLLGILLRKLPLRHAA